MQWNDAWHFVRCLKRRGYVEIGDGLFSVVLAKPGSDRVIKVCKGRSDSWPDYILWATKSGYAGRFAPRVYSFRRIDSVSGGRFYVAVIERLDLTASKISPLEGDARYTQYAVARDIVEEWRVDQNKIARLECTQPGMTDFCRAFTRFAECHGYCRDVHSGNWMFKGDRLVLTDPICSEDKPTTVPDRVRSREFESLRSIAA